MSVIYNLPTWARAEALAFRDTGHLSGDNVRRQAVPAGMEKEAEAQLTQQLDQLVKCDETPLDEAQGQPGLVKFRQMGLEATVTFDDHAVSMETAGPLVTAAYAEFNPQATSLIQIMDLGDGRYATVAARFDQQNPSESYFELKNLP